MENDTSSYQEQEVMNQIKEHQQNQKLNASELGELYSNYMGDSLFSCVFEHHLQVVEDEEVKEYIEFALKTSKKNLIMLKEIYTKENIPAPIGFGEQDVRKDAPRLFSDIFILYYIAEMSKVAIVTYGSAISSAHRQDLIDYFKLCLHDSLITFEKGSHLLAMKGKDTPAPTIPYPKKVDFVEKKSFISLIAGKNRPLTALEIKHLHVNLNTNILGKALMLGFSQLASSSRLRKFFQQGAQIADKQIKSLGSFLTNENLPVPPTMEAHVSDSTTPPFSDKLMLYHTTLANQIGISNYGQAIAKIMRHDIHAQFATLIADIGKYANEGLNLTIENGWLEEPPTAADRKQLSKSSPGSRSEE
ncbi:DUF3231 family protein [Aquibacillus koreensis]|uniref:DUF3231 family protein n=1 Tax=Aquibacillus koreensis TaxID=279446 RepID=A0A9X3WH92_9BACI|nr:DUF3231 family protein [Aquibacillus koreensis]MCT2537140.1 DUF3231 family protein [Aquibacillus koreensis]MDC3419877.1 DUF3231 family protein [Aquibacillus koreensis]